MFTASTSFLPEFQEREGVGPGAQGDGFAVVAGFADGLHEGNLAEQADAQALRHRGAAVVAEDVVFLVRMLLRREPGHVLHQPEDGPVDGRVLEHVHAFLHVGEGHGLGRRDDDGAFHRDIVHQGDVDVAGARGHVDEQIVQRTPLDLQDHLFQGAAGHRPAPDEGLSRLGEIADGHPFDAVLLDRDEEFLALFLAGFGLGLKFFRRSHDGHGGTVHIGIGEPHPVSQAGQRDGQVHGDGGLAHAALAGGDADDVRDLVHLVQVQVQRRLLRLRGLFDDGLHLHIRSAGGVAVYGGPYGPFEIILQGIRPLPERERHDDAPGLDLHLFHHSEAHEVLVILSGMLDLREPSEYFFLSHYCARSSSAMMLDAPPSFSTRKRT